MEVTDMGGHVYCDGSVHTRNLHGGSDYRERSVKVCTLASGARRGVRVSRFRLSQHDGCDCKHKTSPVRDGIEMAQNGNQRGRESFAKLMG